MRTATLLLQGLTVALLLMAIFAGTVLILLAARHEHLASVEASNRQSAFHHDDILVMKQGQVRAVIPGGGGLLALLRRPLGLGLMVYLPASLVIFAEAARLRRAYTRTGYSARLEI